MFTMLSRFQNADVFLLLAEACEQLAMTLNCASFAAHLEVGSGQARLYYPH